jgi:hypothetical protein
MSEIQTFQDGDRVQIENLSWIKKRYRLKRGKITGWVHDNLYRIRLDCEKETDLLFNAARGEFKKEN